MAWTETTRRQYVRKSTRYASDMTDREWDLSTVFAEDVTAGQAPKDLPA